MALPVLSAGLSLLAICAFVAPANASPEIGPVMKIKGYTTIGYDPRNGKTYPLTGYERFGRRMYWTRDGAYFGMYDTTPGSENHWCTLDWGDLGTPGTGFSIGGCYVMVLGNQAVPTPGGELAITWLAEENGRNSTGRIPWARLILHNMPGFPPSPPGWASAWLFAINFQMTNWVWTLDGNDLDGDGLVDFGYSYWFRNMPAGTTDAGITFGRYSPIGSESGGAEHLFDMFADPNYYTYYGTYWFSGPYYAQFCQKLHNVDCPVAGTTPPGVLDYCWTDIYPPRTDADPWASGDCVVNISDLAVLLPNYNQPGEYTYFDGDVYPKPGSSAWPGGTHWYAGDGVVNISDLAQMLAQYNDNCNDAP